MRFIDRIRYLNQNIYIESYFTNHKPLRKTIDSLKI